MDIEAKQIFEDYIKARGLKATSQRNLILDAFLTTEEHLTAEDIHRIVNIKKSQVGFATVYRTMKLITDSGLASEVAFGDGISRFEHKYGHPHHHHLICTECGNVTEFSSRKMDAVEKHILQKYSFQAESHHFKIIGLCRTCRQMKKMKKMKKRKKKERNRVNRTVN